jgi:hypothetical protein
MHDFPDRFKCYINNHKVSIYDYKIAKIPLQICIYIYNFLKPCRQHFSFINIQLNGHESEQSIPYNLPMPQTYGNQST